MFINKYILDIYSLVWFYGISTIVDYLMPNQYYTYILDIYDMYTRFVGRCPRGVMVKAMDSGIVLSEFELQSRYYVHFRANTLGKLWSPLILPAMV